MRYTKQDEKDGRERAQDVKRQVDALIEVVTAEVEAPSSRLWDAMQRASIAARRVCREYGPLRDDDGKLDEPTQADTAWRAQTVGQGE